MTITSKLTEKDVINANFAILSGKTALKIVISFYIIICLVSIGLTVATNKFNISQIIIPLVVVGTFTVLLYISAKRSFTSNPRLSETILYSFDPDMLRIKGESFQSEFSWNKIYKVTLTKNWLLIWQSKQIAQIINRKNVPDEATRALKDILRSQGVKNNL